MERVTGIAGRNTELSDKSSGLEPGRAMVRRSSPQVACPYMTEMKGPVRSDERARCIGPLRDRSSGCKRFWKRYEELKRSRWPLATRGGIKVRTFLSLTIGSC